MAWRPLRSGQLTAVLRRVSEPGRAGACILADRTTLPGAARGPARGPSPYDSDDGDHGERDDSDDEDGGEIEPTLGAPERGDWYVPKGRWADGARGDHERAEDHDQEFDEAEAGIADLDGAWQYGFTI
jgi:hypothetical protein